MACCQGKGAVINGNDERFPEGDGLKNDSLDNPGKSDRFESPPCPSLREFSALHKVDLQSDMLELIEESSACISSVLDPGEPIVWVSDKFLDMVGHKREEVLGRKCSFLQGAKTTSLSHAEIRRIIESREEGFVSLMDAEFETAIYLRPLYNEGQCNFFLASQADIRGCQAPVSPGPPLHEAGPAAPPALPADVPIRESMLEFRIDGQTSLANEGPMSFDNEWVRGSVLVGTRLEPLDPRSSKLFNEQSKRKRCIALQMQLEFKRVPENAQWYVAGEIDGAVTLGLGTRLASTFLLSLIKAWDKTMSYSLGSKSSSAFISSSLGKWIDLNGPIEVGRNYVWESGTSFIDAERWQVINVPGGKTISLTPFWESRPLCLVIYARQGESPQWIRVFGMEFHWRGN